LEGERHQSFLTPLVHLTDLHFRDISGQFPAALLLHSLQRMRGLTRLSLECDGESWFGSDHMAQLLSHLPRLSCLTLQRYSRIQSLQFLSTPSLANSLTDLHLLDCPIMHEPQHLHGLHALTSLIIRCPTAPTPDALVEWRRLRPRTDEPAGDLLLPHLVEFRFDVGNSSHSVDAFTGASRSKQ